MDKIYIRDLEFIGYHGVFEEEKKLGQKFYLSLELSTDLRWSRWNSKENIFSKEIWFNRNFSRGYSKRSVIVFSFNKRSKIRD